jgi:AcrR family transcriptional regulator
MPVAAPVRARARARKKDPLFAGLPSRQATILRAALDLFVERGYGATTVPSVARRAGVAAGTIYLYFDSKDALVNALLVHIKGALGARIVAACRPKDAPRRQFGAIHAAFGRWVIDHPRASHFCDLHHHAAYVTPETLAAFEPAMKAIDAHLLAGRREGRYRDLPVPALRALLIGPLWALVKFGRMGELSVSPALVAQAEEAAWAGVCRPRSRATAAPSRARGRRKAAP